MGEKTVLNRRAFVSGFLAAGTGALAACAGGPPPRQADAGATAKDGAPTTAELMKAGPLGDMALGNPDAPVTIIEYASLTCPYCHAFHVKTYPKLKKAYIDTGKVYYIVREFPIGRAAGAAAIATRCVPEEDYFALFDKYLKQRTEWVSQKVRKDAIYKIAAQTGLSRQAFDSCMANQDIIDGLKWVKQRGREFGVAGTPTFFINGEKVRGVLTFDQMKAKIEPQIG